MLEFVCDIDSDFFTNIPMPPACIYYFVCPSLPLLPFYRIFRKKNYNLAGLQLNTVFEFVSQVSDIAIRSGLIDIPEINSSNFDIFLIKLLVLTCSTDNPCLGILSFN